MNGKLLVAYATRYGSTAEVAEAVGTRLRERGFDVGVKPVKQAPSLDGYDAVVFGTPFYLGAMLKEGRAWLESQRAALETRPNAIFAFGPTSAADDLAETAKQLDKTLAELPWLSPVAARMFVGAYDPTKLRFADRLLTKLPASPLHGLAAHDDRDWDAIGEWADETAEALEKAAVGGGAAG
jgi:menaquinone-dependent protoporphyrinogen oxidase